MGGAARRGAAAARAGGGARGAGGPRVGAAAPAEPLPVPRASDVNASHHAGRPALSLADSGAASASCEAPRRSCWRHIADDGVGAAAGLAADEVLMAPYRHGASAAHAATLRLYTYRAHCALVGRYQSLESEVDVRYCEAHGIDIGRRPTGGGAIIMGPGQLGVALAIPAPTGARGTVGAPGEAPRQTLQRLAVGVVAGLAELGIDAGFRAKNDIEVDGRKIAGLGLYRDDGDALLFHASVLVDLDVELMLRVLRIPGAKLSDKAVGRVEQRVTTASRELGRRLSAADVRPAFRRGFARAFGASFDERGWDAGERAAVQQLVAAKHGTAAWLHQRGPRSDARGESVCKTPEGLVRIYVGVHGGVIKSVLVCGDFNAMPPELSRLEAALKWCSAQPARVRAAAAAALGPTALGVSAERLADAVCEAVERAAAAPPAAAASPARAAGSCYLPAMPGEEPS